MLSFLLAAALVSSDAAHSAAVPAPLAAPVTINIDAAADRHAIDPRIYGVAWATEPAITDLGITINRWGGNAMSRYNWEFSTANRCKDYYFENQPDAVAGDGSNGESADNFIGPTLAAGADALITIPIMGLLPKDRSIRCGYATALYGGQDDFDPDWDCGNGKSGGLRMLHVNDPADTSAVYPASHQGDWVQHLVTAHNGGVRYYALDNEPALWSFDHWDIHPDGSTYDEVWGKMEEYGAVIRAADPDAIITGIEEWGWDGYFVSGLDMENGWPYADRAAHGGVGFAEWQLQQARAHEESTGVRILDVAALHFYPQSGEFSDNVTTEMQLLRNESTRALWDPTYVDKSWIGETGYEGGDGGKVRLIPRLKEWTNLNYPGTLTAITEYNWGAEGSMGGTSHINGATAQADILGIFGREGLNIGVRWTTPAGQSHAYNAFKMYRNYDGAHSQFGDLSVSTAVPDPDQLSAFAALRSSDRKMTIMIVAKDLADSTPLTVSLANFVPSGTAQRFELDSANAITPLAAVTPVAGSLSLTVPPQSITLLVLAGTYIDAPASLTATATSTSQVGLTWSAVPGATGYEIHRSSGGAPFSLVTTTGATTTHNDGSLSANTTYLYRVRALVGGVASGFSPVDPATTIIFTNPTLTTSTVVLAAHMTELRTAVNAMRAAAGLPATVFPALTAGSTIKTTDVGDLRRALDPARATIGVPLMAYTDRALIPGATRVKAAHVTELRNGIR